MSPVTPTVTPIRLACNRSIKRWRGKLRGYTGYTFFGRSACGRAHARARAYARMERESTCNRVTRVTRLIWRGLTTFVRVTASVTV